MLQTLDTLQLKLHHWAMQAPNEELLREALKAFLSRKGYGALTSLSEESGLSRMTLTRFRDGKRPEESTLHKVAAILEKEGFFRRDLENFAERTDQEKEWAFNRRLIQGLLRNDPAAKLALGLRDIAEKLLDDSALQKEAHILEFVKYLTSAVQTYITEVKERNKGGS